MGPGQDISTERYYHGVDMIAMFLYILKRAYWIVLAVAVGAVAFRFYVKHYVAPVYEATAKLYIAGSDSTISQNDLQLGSSLANDFQEAFKTWRVCDMVNERLGTQYSYEALSRMVSTSNPKGSHILYVTVASTDPGVAQSLANAYAEAVREYIADVMEMRRPQLLEEARRPSTAAFPNVKRSTKNGAVVGGLLAAMLLAVLFLADDRIRSAEDVSNTVQLPVFGTIPFQKPKQMETIKEPNGSSPKEMPRALIRVRSLPDRSGAESIDAICTGITFAGNKLKRIAITSCRQNEGKSFTALQLSMCMAKRGKKTLLIDGDLRKSVLRDKGLIRLEGSKSGLALFLSGQCELTDAVYATSVPDLFLLPDGERVNTPLALISSPDFDDMLEKLAGEFDMIFIDTPPIGSVVDAAEIARRCDGSMIVVESRKASGRALKEAVDRLQKTGTPVLGCILNKN